MIEHIKIQISPHMSMHFTKYPTSKTRHVNHHLLESERWTFFILRIYLCTSNKFQYTFTTIYKLFGQINTLFIHYFHFFMQ